MGKTNFQTLKNLVSSLSKKLDKMSEGQLHINDIETLTEEAREVYERIVIIRFKSYESLNEPSEDVELEADQEESVQTEETSDTDDGMMMFDFTNEDIESEPQAKTPTGEVLQAEEVSEPESVDPEKTLGAETNDASLNDNFKNDASSVANKFEKAAIADLKEHIGINRKFLYINDLFNGDSEAYNSAIHTLNSHESINDALKQIDNLKAEYGWDENNTAVSGFIEIIERRYIV